LHVKEFGDAVPEPDVVDELSEEIAALVHHLVNAWDEYLEAKVREMDVGLTGRQATALWMAHDPLSMGQLSRQLGCDPSSATGIVDRLERKGLVRRVSDPADRRAKRVELTPDGRKVRRRIEQRVMAARPSIAGLSKGEQRQLRDLLRKAMDGL
jgi:MarR family transcriptional regulator, organic hydroperoxide resistance regulator